MSQLPLFWCGLGGTVGISLGLSLTRGLPPISLATITTARLRVQSAAGAVTYLDAVVLAGATATNATIRHALGLASFPGVGVFRLWGEISLDGGTSWYPTGEFSIEVTP